MVKGTENRNLRSTKGYIDGGPYEETSSSGSERIFL